MKAAVIQVGDHAPEPVHRNVAAEAFAVTRMSWSVDEYLALADRYHDAASAFRIAVNNGSFAGIRSAFLTLTEIARQTEGLNAGLFHAIESAQQESRRDHYRR